MGSNLLFVLLWAWETLFPDKALLSNITNFRHFYAPKKKNINYTKIKHTYNLIFYIIFGMDKIFLRNLKVKTRIGIFEWEKAVDQMININLILYLDIKKSAKSKKIEDSVNYKSISKRIISLAENNKFELVESMIENMAEIILNEYNIQQITISISKPGAIRGSDDVGIEITRP
ncbi:MAG: hypothetical protein CM15mP93_06270 [Thiotrichaceae bacterium]|nr:MAG: hypothetical protein CM15mP93_06270 [Thiotrichaceae bacterium]